MGNDSKEKHDCAKRVYSGARHDFSGHMCTRKATVERNGKWWCKQHDPEAESARMAAREAKWKAEDEAKEAVHGAALALAERLGAGKPDYSWTAGTYTGGVTLTAEEAEALARQLGR